MTILASFNPRYGSGVTVAPGVVSAESPLPAGEKSVCLTNLDTVTCYVRIGAPGITATTADYPVPPSAQVVITKAQDQSAIAYVTGAGAASLHIMTGEGF